MATSQNGPAGSQPGVERCYKMSGHYLQVMCTKFQCKIDFVSDQVVQNAIYGHLSGRKYSACKLQLYFPNVLYAAIGCTKLLEFLSLIG